ncbi:MAG TPA: hypothetical protein VJW20_07555 [Candidatus Angelobacter sp.]|nr:hypothetical protein [Candidatus Angelobacter sp.]
MKHLRRLYAKWPAHHRFFANRQRSGEAQDNLSAEKITIHIESALEPQLSSLVLCGKFISSKGIFSAGFVSSGVKERFRISGYGAA